MTVLRDSASGTGPGKDKYSGVLGRAYSFCIARPAIARPLSRLIWASDFRPLYRSLDSLSLIEADVVVDIGCGAGLTLHWLDPARVGHYVGIDSSPAMLVRARRVVRRRGFAETDFRRADAAAIPLPGGTVDLCLLYNGLHCFPRPRLAVAEAVRCLKPAGRLAGSMLVRGEQRRADRLMEREAARRRALMGPGGTALDLRGWLEKSALHRIQIEITGSLAIFTAQRQTSTQMGDETAAFLN